MRTKMARPAQALILTLAAPILWGDELHGAPLSSTQGNSRWKLEVPGGATNTLARFMSWYVGDVCPGNKTKVQ